MPTPRGPGRCSCGRKAADRCGLLCSSCAPPARHQGVVAARRIFRPEQPGYPTGKTARVMATLTASNITDKVAVNRATLPGVRVCEPTETMEDRGAVFPVDRRRRILQQVAEQQTIRIGELARELGVSEMTIRRDISRLEQDGFLRHTYGGATAHLTKSIELAFNARALEHTLEKRLIGMRAADDLAGTRVLYVGPGTTTEQFSLFLARIAGQQVITASLPVASLLGSRPAHVVALGGTVREEELACVGPIAAAALARYRVDVAVIG